MTTHKPADWAKLGQAVHEARKEKGLGKTREWAAAVGRSERTLLELERGGKVGTATLEDIEDALQWPRAGAYRVLNGLPWRDLNGPREVPGSSDTVAEAIARIERRLSRIEEQLGKVGTEHGDSSAQKSAGDDPDVEGATVTRLPRDPKPSDSGGILNPAALDTDTGLDEEPGGSEHD